MMRSYSKCLVRCEHCKRPMLKYKRSPHEKLCRKTTRRAEKQRREFNRDTIEEVLTWP